MNLLACFKIVPDMEAIDSTDWEVDDSLSVDLSYVRPIWNCFDESSLEMLLKLSDLSEGFCSLVNLWALTVGKKNADSYLSTLYALGYERAIRIEEEKKELRFWPDWTAEVIAAYVRRACEVDAVVMGSVSSDGNNGKTPLLTAEKLGWPCVTQVIQMELVDEGHLRVTSMQDQGKVTQVVTLPCVFSVGNAPCSYLRVPTLKDRMKRGRRPIEYLSWEELGIQDQTNREGITLEALEPMRQERDGQRIEGEDIREKVKLLYEEYLKERLERL